MNRLVLVDTNLLLLWVVGTVDQRQVGRGRTQEYTTDDFYLLLDYLQHFQGICVTRTFSQS